MKIREERVFIEGSNVDRTFLETLKQVKRDDFVSLRTAIEDHQSNYFSSSVTSFFLEIWKTDFHVATVRSGNRLHRVHAGHHGREI